MALVITERTSPALDGFAVTVHYEKHGLGIIHDAIEPGELRRYDLRGDRTVGWSALAANAVYLCISPGGDQVAFTRADGGMALVSIDGGDPIELGSYTGGQAGNPGTMLQWPVADSAQWIYFRDCRPGVTANVLRRVNVWSKQMEDVITFNRGGWPMLSPDMTPHAGHAVLRTDNYDVVVYDFTKGDGNLKGVPTWNPGCGNCISPDGLLFASNTGIHTGCTLLNMQAQSQADFRVNQYEGDPCSPALGLRREQLGWAWQSFRWATNSQNWINVTQGRLKIPSNFEVLYMDSELYDWKNGRQLGVTHNRDGVFDRAGGFWDASIKGYEPFGAEPTDKLASTKLPALVKKLAGAKTFQPVLDELDKLAAPGQDADKALEATRLRDHVLCWGRTMLRRAQALETTDLPAAAKLYKKLCAQYAGIESGDAAAKRLEDPALAGQLAEWDKVAKVLACANAVMSPTGTKHAGKAKDLGVAFEVVKKDCPGSASERIANSAVERVNAWAIAQGALAKSLESERPGDAETIDDDLIERFAGQLPAQDAKARLDDPTFKRQLEAWNGPLRKLQAAEAGLAAVPGSAASCKDKKWVERNGQAVSAMIAPARQLKAKFDDTAAWAEAQRTLKRYDIDVPAK